MNLLVCARYGADPAGTRGEYCTNPFDLFAMEMAARIKDATGARLFVLTHGDTAAEAALRDCIAAGADCAYRICGTGDSAALLSEAIIEIEQQAGTFSAVFCGNQSIDGGSRYTGPALAEFLHRPFVSDAIDARAELTSLHITQEGEQQNRILCVPYPCVTAVTKPLFVPRQSTIRARMAANRAEVTLLHGMVSDKTGTAQCTFTYAGLPAKGPCTFFTGAPSEACSKLVQILTQQGVF